MSYTHFSLYKECGHRYLLENIIEQEESLPTIYSLFGDAIHDTLKKGVENGLNEEERINNFKYVFTKLVKDYLIETQEYNKLETFLNQGIEILKLIPTDRLSEKYIFIGAEHVISETLYKNYIFVGFIDLVLKDKKTGKYVIIDWKTSTAPWDIENKLKDEVFVSQMKFYKYFYAKKKRIPLKDIECKYIVLSRYKEKNNEDAGYGHIENVEIETDEQSIEIVLEELAKTTRDIFIRKIFTKAKLENRKNSCYFCPFKDSHMFCNDDKEQYLKILDDLKEKK